MGYKIQYPDVLTSKFVLKTNQPSITLPILQSSQIEQIFVKNGSKISSNDDILILRNNSDYRDIKNLAEDLSQLKLENKALILFFENYINKELELGDIIERDWIQFMGNLLEYYKITHLDSYEKQIDYLQEELEGQEKLEKHYQVLINGDIQEKSLIKDKNSIDSMLFFEGVISKLEYNVRKIDKIKNDKYLYQNVIALQRVGTEKVKLKNAIKNYQQVELQNLLDLKLNLRESYNSLKTSIDAWHKTYVLTSPIEGTVNFLQNIEQGKFFVGDIIIITPKNNNHYAILNIPVVGAGKIEVGQKVILKLNDYPYREYGILEGVLSEINQVPGGEFYLGKVELDEKKGTHYGQKIDIKESMSGIGEIVANDRSLLGRLFERILYVFQRN